MEELIIRGITEIGFPAIIAIYLLTKGVNALNELTRSVTELTKTVSKLGDLEVLMKRFELCLDKLERSAGYWKK